MAHLLRFFALLLLIGSMTQAAAPPPLAAHSLLPITQFTEVKVASTALHLGQAQQLSAKFERSPGELVILLLALTYPSGLKRTVVGSTSTGEATLAWQIPPEAGFGKVTYQLSTSGCGCGYGQDGKPKVALQSFAEGSFMIK